MQHDAGDMQRKIINLPCCLFAPLSDDWIINVRGRAGNDGVTGTGQVVYGSEPRWETKLDLSGFGSDRVLTWRAISSQMRGRVNVLRVCVCDRHRTTWKKLGLPDPNKDGIPHSDGAGFSDGSTYRQDLTFVAPQTWTAGLSEIEFDPAQIANALQPGQYFSHNDWLYRVTGIFDDGAVTRYTFEPPLRRSIPAGDEVSLKATSLMVFETDLEGRMPLSMGKHGDTSISLLEWTNRP